MKQSELEVTIRQVITTMMDRVLERVLVEDPFIPEQHKAKKPLYAALVPDEIFKSSHFERRFVTPFGKVWEKLAKVVSEIHFDEVSLNHSINANIYSERLKRINEVLRNLEHPKKGKERIKPIWEKEISYILKGKGELIPVSVTCDLFVSKQNSNEKYAFEIKAPLPNSDQTKVSKQKLLKLLAMTPSQVKGAFFALPYNPYGKREEYSWSFPNRWFNMREDESVLIGDEFWDFIGGDGTYKNFINVVNKLGLNYRRRIYREFLGMEPPKDDKQIKI